MDFTIKVNRNTFLVVVPPEIITSSQVVKVCTHQTPLVHQGSPWCALVLQLKQPVRWIMNGESFIQSTGVGVLETLDEAPQLYKLASQTNFTMYFPHAVKGRVSRAFPPAPYPQLSDHLIAAPGKELWGNHALTLSSGRWWFNENVEPLPSYTPPPPLPRPYKLGAIGLHPISNICRRSFSSSLFLLTMLASFPQLSRK